MLLQPNDLSGPCGMQGFITIVKLAFDKKDIFIFTNAGGFDRLFYFFPSHIVIPSKLVKTASICISQLIRSPQTREAIQGQTPIQREFLSKHLCVPDKPIRPFFGEFERS